MNIIMRADLEGEDPSRTAGFYRNVSVSVDHARMGSVESTLPRIPVASFPRERWAVAAPVGQVSGTVVGGYENLAGLVEKYQSRGASRSSVFGGASAFAH
jgi:hypothetical protein